MEGKATDDEFRDELGIFFQFIIAANGHFDGVVFGSAHTPII